MESAKYQVESCLSGIDYWMTANKLKLNNDKTEITVLSAAHRPRPPIESLKCCDHIIPLSSSVRDIGVILDDKMTLVNQITSICKSCFFHIRNIWRIRKHISMEVCETLVHAFISSKLDFCNSLLYGIPNYQIQKLQRVQNAAARLVSCCHKYDHITPVLRHLHWLPVDQRINYKILLLTFKALNDCASPYIRELIEPYVPVRQLRYASSHLLTRGSYNLKTYGKRAFSNAAPELWNSLPVHIRSYTDITLFKRDLKTFLFKNAYSL